MIQLTCTNCETVLTIDEAFAGGACRCQHCGTIQTVPTQMGVSKRPATPGGVAPGKGVVRPKALYQGQASSPADELDALAQAVASSGLGTGLTGTGLRSAEHEQRAAAPASRPAPAATGVDRKTLILLGAGLAAGLLVAILGMVFIMGDRSGGSPAPKPAGGTPQAAAPDPSTPANPAVGQPTGANQPNYMNIPLAGPSVVYILDRGQGTADTFDALKGAAHLSILSLGPERRFQVLFWDREGDVVAAPKEGLRPASEAYVHEARQAMANVFIGGQTKIGPALEKALAQEPADIVIATGKYGLDEEFTKAVLDARGSRAVRIHTFCLGPAGSPDALRQIATRTGGQFAEVTGLTDLREFARWTPN